MTTPKLTKAQHKLLKHFASFNSDTSPPGMPRTLRNLVSRGLVRYVNGKTQEWWEITDAGRDLMREVSHETRA